MGTDELTRIHELAKRVTLLEKMALRQQSRMDELLQRLEAAERGAGHSESSPTEARQTAADEAAEENAAAELAVPSVSDLLDEEMKRDLARAYGAPSPSEQSPAPPQERPPAALARAAGS